MCHNWPPMRDTPLAMFLDRAGLHQTEFARRISRHLERKVEQSEVSRWATGKHLPCRATRRAIAKATGGAVKPESWVKSKPRKSA